MSEKANNLQNGDEFEFTFAVNVQGDAVLVGVPENVKPLLDGSFLEDNCFAGVSNKTPAGFYKARAQYNYLPGYVEGYRAPGEDEVSFLVSGIRKVADA